MELKKKYNTKSVVKMKFIVQLLDVEGDSILGKARGKTHFSILSQATFHPFKSICVYALIPYNSKRHIYFFLYIFSRLLLVSFAVTNDSFSTSPSKLSSEAFHISNHRRIEVE